MKRLLLAAAAFLSFIALLGGFSFWRHDRQINEIAEIAGSLQDNGAEVTIGQRGPFGGGTAVWLPWNQRIIHITINATEVDDESILKMNRFDAIETLIVEGKGLDAKRLNSLASIERLRRLVLQGTHLPARDIELLHEKLPDAEVVDVENSR